MSRTWLGCWKDGEGPTGSGYYYGLQTGSAPVMLGTGKLDRRDVGGPVSWIEGMLGTGKRFRRGVRGR
jgi:hypothetical protein